MWEAYFVGTFEVYIKYTIWRFIIVDIIQWEAL